MQSTPLHAAARRVLPYLVMVVATLLAPLARGADPAVEKQAQTLQKKAVEEDSLNVNYPDAIKKLATAISKCGTDKCNTSLRGALYRDLGAMLILSGSVDDGRTAFVKAIGLDPSLELDPAYKSPMLEGLWNDAKRKAGTPGGGGGAAPPASAPEPSPAVQSGAAATGDFAHVPPGAQLVRTPLPIYAEYLGTEKLLRVVVKYRGAGMTDWKPVELRKMESGYGGLIPCADVAEGSMQYYIQGYGTTDDPVASSGSRSKPYGVPIVQSALSGPGPSLPGQEPPRQCAEAVGGTDCPPDFPGCHVQKKSGGEDCHRNGECESGQCASGKCVEKKSEGEDCDKDEECTSGNCSDSRCAAAKKAGGESCDVDDDCASGTCKNNKCAEVEAKKSGFGKTKRIWIGLGVSLDLMALPQADNVCVLNNSGRGPLNSAGYECVDPSTSQNFPGSGPVGRVANGQIVTAGTASQRGDYIGGGLSPGNLRILASFDYALNMNFLVGARAGYVLFTDPASNPGPAFAPIHLEARVSYLVGKDALASKFAPILLVGLGAGEFDANIGVTVKMCGVGSAGCAATTGTGYPAGTRNENAWVTAGPFFLAAGGGLRFLFSSSLAATAVIKGEAAFGGSAGSLLGVAPEIGMQLGL